MVRFFIILLSFSQVSLGFTQTQITPEQGEFNWVHFAVLAAFICISCVCGYLWWLNHRLLRSKHKLSVLWHRIPDILTEVDSDGVIHAVNQPLSEHLQIEDIIGTSSYDYLSLEDSALFRDSLRRALSEFNEVEYELSVSLGDEIRYLSNRIVPLRLNDSEPRALVITSDISHYVEATKTLQQAKDQAEENAQAKASFLARMSHEIRTPLGGIIGMANLLNESDGRGNLKQFSEPLVSSAYHLQQIVDDVLDLAKTDTGEIQLDEADTSLWHILDDLEGLYAQQAKQKQLSLSISLAADVPRIINADAFRLRQVLYNLFSNAVKFTHEGGIALNISIEQLVDTRLLKFSVKDSGVGVPKNSQLSIFDVFKQAHGQIEKRYGGTGLGLSICKNLVEIMGGVMGVESDGESGADFWFTLPLKAASHDMAFNSGVITAVLAIQDEDKRTWFEGFLQAMSIEYRLVTEAEVHPEPYSLLITDYLLDVEALHLWWVGAESELPSGGGTILYEPYRREGLLNRILAYVGNHDPYMRMPEEGAQDNIPDNAKTMSESMDSISVVHDTTINRPDEMIQPVSVLVVDDNVTNQIIIQKTLEKMGYQVGVASNGEEAVTAFLNGVFQGVIMDVQMPVMDGIEATRRIRAAEKKHVPIIALTANAQDSIEEACFAAGMDAFLTKPINKAELKSTLDNILGIENHPKSS